MKQSWRTHRGLSCVESARRSRMKKAQVSRAKTRWLIRPQIKTLALFDAACLMQHASSMMRPDRPKRGGAGYPTSNILIGFFPGASFLLTASEGSNITVWSRRSILIILFNYSLIQSSWAISDPIVGLIIVSTFSSIFLL